MNTSNLRDQIKQHLENAFGNTLFDGPLEMTEETRDQVKAITNDLLMGRYPGLRDYETICDETNNTLADIENGTVNVTITAPAPSLFVEIEKYQMDYETYIEIRQYFPDGDFHYTLKVTDVMGMDYYYDGIAKTLDDVMECIKLGLKRHEN